METRANGNLPEVHGNTFRQHLEGDGVNIDLNYRILSPKKEHSKPPDPNNLIIFLPGWATEAGTKTAGAVGQSFANEANRQTLVIDTKPDKAVNDTLYKEAEAVSRLVKQMGATKITIAGYSEGGIKAVDLAVILQNNPKITIDGVILMESMGLYNEDSKRGFVGRFVGDTLKSSRYLFRRKTLTRGANFGTDVFFGWIKDMARTNVKYPQRVMSQVKEMSETQKHVKELTTPVILVHGHENGVSNPEKVVPGYQYLDVMKKDEETGLLYDPRERFLKNTLFPNSPFVRMVTSRNLPHHTMPVLRAEQVARDSLYLLKRYWRNK